MAELELIATSTMGLEAVVASGLEDLVYKADVVEQTRKIHSSSLRAAV